MAEGAWRVSAFVLGAAGLIVLALGTVGGALIALAAIGVALVIQRKRGRQLTGMQAYLTAVATCGTLVLIGGSVIMLRRSPDGRTVWQAAHAAMQQAATERARHPRPPPAFLRNLPGADQPPVQMPTNTAFMVLSMILGGEFTGIVIGTLVWAAGWLILYGLKGPAQLLPGRPSAPG